MWTFEIPTGRVFNPDGSLDGTGYAGGNLGKVPEAVNNVDYVDVPFVGPLPPGEYDMVELIPESHLGPNAIRLEPRPGDDGTFAWLHGRGEFYVHADLKDRATHPRSASEGCLVYDGRMSMWDSDDHGLRVVPFSQPSTTTGISGV